MKLKSPMDIKPEERNNEAEREEIMREVKSRSIAQRKKSVCLFILACVPVCFFPVEQFLVVNLFSSLQA